jgi:23S rRNA (cytidine1920-2'-O)/16S rRNA (cytidine1409-2'-O)-methyltransferase
VTRASSLVTADAPIAVLDDGPRFVSRGGHKLDRALDRLDVEVADKNWLDVGASTGGFTDCLLKRGASSVIALDVGYGQLAWPLRNDDRVHVIERRNVRELKSDELPFTAQGVTADLSFISLTLALDAIVKVADRDADYVLLVKPQFEVGRDAVGPGGVVRDPELWTTAVQAVAEKGAQQGLGIAGAAPSEMPGPKGNREFFLHLRRGASGDRFAIERAVAEAP